MGRLDDGEFQGRGNLLREYEVFGSHSFRSLYDFKEICRDFYTDLVEGDMEGKSQYLGFTHVRMGDIFRIDKIRREIPKMTILYDFGEESLIVKFMVGVPHDTCGNLLAKYFDKVVCDRAGEDDHFLDVGSGRFRAVRRMKEADHAFKPSSRDLELDWPTLVFEVCVCERLPQLQQDARFWLECSGGQTCIVIILKVDKTERTIVIQRWQDGGAQRQQPVRNMNVPNPYARNCFPTLMQTLTLEEGQGYTGASLIIPAALVYDVLPPMQGAPLGPRDFEITSQLLNRLNRVFWNGIR